MTDMMTPYEIKRIREWARKGNNPIPIEDLGSLYYANVWTNRERAFWARLNSAGLTIAALADALEQANAVAEESQAWVGSPGLDDEIETMRANKTELLG